MTCMCVLYTGVLVLVPRTPVPRKGQESERRERRDVTNFDEEFYTFYTLQISFLFTSTMFWRLLYITYYCAHTHTTHLQVYLWKVSLVTLNRKLQLHDNDNASTSPPVYCVHVMCTHNSPSDRSKSAKKISTPS